MIGQNFHHYQAVLLGFNHQMVMLHSYEAYYWVYVCVSCGLTALPRDWNQLWTLSLLIECGILPLPTAKPCNIFAKKELKIVGFFEHPSCAVQAERLGRFTFHWKHEICH